MGVYDRNSVESVVSVDVSSAAMVTIGRYGFRSVASVGIFASGNQAMEVCDQRSVGSVVSIDVSSAAGVTIGRHWFRSVAPLPPLGATTVGFSGMSPDAEHVDFDWHVCAFCICTPFDG